MVGRAMVPLVAALLVTACAGGPSATPNPTGSAAPTALPDGRVDAAVAQLDAIVERAMASSGVPGLAVAVAHDGGAVYTKGFGVRRVGTDAKVDADTVFQLASVSKPVGASVVAAVVGAKEVSWDDPVVGYLPSFALSDQYVTKHVTVGDLYAMRSGLPGEVGDELEQIGFDRSEIIARLRYAPLDPFRAVYHYTNFGITVGAEAVAAATKTPWETLSTQRIYGPLGMSRTTSDHAVFLAMPNRAELHTFRDGVWAARQTRDATAQSPAGGVSSSARDFARWLAMEADGGLFEGRQVVAAQALQESRIPRIASIPAATADQPSTSSGYGIQVASDPSGRMRYAFSGAFTAGAATNIVLLPAERLGISVFTNGQPVGVPEAITAEFMDVVEFGASTRDWLAYAKDAFAKITADTPAPSPSPAAKPPAPLATYVGTYRNDWVGPVVVRSEGSGLVAVAGPARLAFPLAAFDGKTFSMTDPQLGIWGGFATFTTAGGRATSVTFDRFNSYGLGTLTRVPG